MITIVVRGTPAPQGSKRFVGTTKAGRGLMVESSKRVKPWRDAVRSDAVAARGQAEPLDGPLYVEMRFYFPRPKSHYRTGKNAHLLRDNAPHSPQSAPDLSKLVRSTEDALTDAGVWVDDARVVHCVSAKYYTDATHPDPGAVIVLGGYMEVWHG